MTSNITPTLPSKIYDQHDKAFGQVSAYVVTKDDEFIATIAFKFPKDGAGRLWAYVHFLCLPMVRGHANGYGYDKRSAAVEDAARRINAEGIKPLYGFDLLISALTDIGGYGWQDRLQAKGFQVLQAV